MAENTSIADIQAKFRTQVQNYRNTGATHLYAHLTEGCAEDPQILALLLPGENKTAYGSTLLFIIVHYLLLKDETQDQQHALAAYYASLTPEPRDPAEAFPHFRDFCLTHAAAIRALAAERYVQYTALGRAAVMLPAFNLIAQQLGGAPFAMFDVGSSAGFLLWWDHYRYDYGFHQVGPTDAQVQIHCEVRGTLRPPFPDQLPQVSARLGMDIDPVDIGAPDQRLWIRANVSAYNRPHAQLVDSAIAFGLEHKPPLIQGDGSTDVTAHARAFAPGQPLVIVDTYVPVAVREAIQAQSRELARERRLFQVTIGSFPVKSGVRLIDYQAGTETILAGTTVQGTFLEWQDEATATGAL
ncbi:MAG: DUF2332 domain-containing protein [Chloroflexi bacterium]|nr:DUF2332 domain-containing protein [Chloroflexota bacterium]